MVKMAVIDAGIRVSQKNQRRLIDVALPIFPEIDYIGFDTFTHVGRLGKHEHRGLFEICLIIRGQVTWWARERTYELRGGDVYFTRPNEPHGGVRELMHPCAIYWIAVKIPKAKSSAANGFLHLPPVEARALCESVHALKERHLRGAEKLQPFFEAIFKHLESKTILGVTQARASLQCMLAVLAGLPMASQPVGFVPPGITRARNFLDDCPRPWPEVAELATLAGMSVSHFHSMFLQQAGTAPMEYSHRARLHKAQQLLQDSGTTVTSVAHSLGYCSSQHMAACFKRYLGMTPTQARTVVI